MWKLLSIQTIEDASYNTEYVAFFYMSRKKTTKQHNANSTVQRTLLSQRRGRVTGEPDISHSSF